MSQLPFSSINYGLDTSDEGRMVTKALLETSIKGVGNGRTSIFPCQIFQYSKEVNGAEGTPNFDLYQLALKSTSKRLYPNYANADWSAQKSWVESDRKMKQEVLDSLSEEEKEQLMKQLELHPELCEKLSIEVVEE